MNDDWHTGRHVPLDKGLVRQARGVRRLDHGLLRCAPRRRPTSSAPAQACDDAAVLPTEIVRSTSQRRSCVHNSDTASTRMQREHGGLPRPRVLVTPRPRLASPSPLLHYITNVIFHRQLLACASPWHAARDLIAIGGEACFGQNRRSAAPRCNDSRRRAFARKLSMMDPWAPLDVISSTTMPHRSHESSLPKREARWAGVPTGDMPAGDTGARARPIEPLWTCTMNHTPRVPFRLFTPALGAQNACYTRAGREPRQEVTPRKPAASLVASGAPCGRQRWVRSRRAWRRQRRRPTLHRRRRCRWSTAPAGAS